MEEITFQGPYHIKHLCKVQDELRNKYAGNKIPGIYIWGFVSDRKISSFKNYTDQPEIPKFDKESEQFIPYYIGKDSNLFKRIEEHKGFDKVPASKYTRMSKEYMLEFFKQKDKEVDFPIKTDRSDIHGEFLRLNLEQKNKKILYYNNSDFLKETYINEPKLKVNDAQKTNNPINIINNENNNLIKDTLKEMYDDSLKNDNISKEKGHKNNLWFCYAELKRNTDFVNCKLEDLETLTFYSLKGKTISLTGKLDEISDNIAVKCDENLKSILLDVLFRFEQLIHESHIEQRDNGA
jgi:hypothetical protein